MVWWGEFAYDASLAFLVGWAFNLIIVEFPQARHRNRVHEAVRYPIERVASAASDMLDALWRNANDVHFNYATKTYDTPPPVRYSDADIAEILKKIDPEASTHLLQISETFKLGKQTWIEYVIETTRNAQKNCQRLLPYVVYLDSRVIAAAADVERDQLNWSARFLSTWQVGNGDMSALTDWMQDFYRKCEAFKKTVKDVMPTLGL
jgi:hypothetical protein